MVGLGGRVCGDQFADCVGVVGSAFGVTLRGAFSLLLAARNLFGAGAVFLILVVGNPFAVGAAFLSFGAGNPFEAGTRASIVV